MKVDKSSKRAPWRGTEPVAFAKEDWRTALYNSGAWRRLAKAEINTQPYCVACAAKGIATTDNLQRDHIHGFTNEVEFWDGERQTLCKRCNMGKAGKWGAKKRDGGAG